MCWECDNEKCIHNKKKITQWLEDMNFIFLWWKTIFHTLALHVRKILLSPRKIKFMFAPPHNVLYAVHSPTQILPTVTCHEFSASLQISQQWFRVHSSVIYEGPTENRLGELGSLYNIIIIIIIIINNNNNNNQCIVYTNNNNNQCIIIIINVLIVYTIHWSYDHRAPGS